MATPEAVLVLEDVSDRELADRAGNDAEIIERDTDEKAVVPRMFDNGTYTRTGRWEAINTDLRYVYDGEYYSVDVETTRATPDVVYDIETEYVGDEEAKGETEYDELPEVDRDALSFLTSDEVTEDGQEDSAEYLYEAGADETSVIVSETTVVAVDGRRFTVETEESNEIERHEFEYTVERIASSRKEFVSWLGDEYGFVLSALTEDERAVLNEAIEEGYREGTAGDAFDSLVGEFQQHEAVEPGNEGGGYWLVEYEGTTYWAEMRH